MSVAKMVTAARRAAKKRAPTFGGGSAPLSTTANMFRIDGLTSTVRATMSLPVYDDSNHDPNSLVVRIGGSEVPILTPVPMGRYPGSDRPRFLYTEFDVSGADSSLTVEIRFDLGPRTLTPLTRTYNSWEDPTTHVWPARMLDDIVQVGKAPAFVLPLPSWHRNSGALGFHAQKSTLETDPDIGPWVTEFKRGYRLFDREYHWNGSDLGGGFILPDTALSHVTRANHAYTDDEGTHDLATANDLSWVTVWTTEPAPQYHYLRKAGGSASLGGGHNYYGRDRIGYKMFLGLDDTDLATQRTEWIQATTYAEWYRAYNQWRPEIFSDGGGGWVGTVKPQPSNAGSFQVEGLAYGYFMTGNQDFLKYLLYAADFWESQATQSNPSLQIGNVSGQAGEARPMSRVTENYLYAALCSRNEYDAIDRTVKLGQHLDRCVSPLSTDWSTITMDDPGSGWGWWEKVGSAPAIHLWSGLGGAINPSTGLPYVNTFMQGMMCSALIKCYDLAGAWIGSTRKTSILDRVKQSADYRWSEMWLATPRPGTLRKSFLNGFDGGGWVFPDNYSETPDLNLMHALTYAFLARELADSSYLTKFRTLFTQGVGDYTYTTYPDYDGNIKPYYYGLKQSREGYETSQDSLSVYYQALHP